MAYSTQADLTQAVGGAARLAQLTDLDNDRNPDAAVITGAIAWADAIIDSYINKQRSVPLAAPIPITIVQASARLAKYNMLSAKGLLDQPTLDEYDRIVKWLEGVRDGAISIGVEPAPKAAAMRVDAQSTRPSGKDVSRKSLRGFS